MPCISSNHPILSCILAACISSGDPCWASASIDVEFLRRMKSYSTQAIVGSVLGLVLDIHRLSLVAPSLCSFDLPASGHMFRCLLSSLCCSQFGHLSSKIFIILALFRLVRLIPISCLQSHRLRISDCHTLFLPFQSTL